MSGESATASGGAHEWQACHVAGPAASPRRTAVEAADRAGRCRPLLRSAERRRAAREARGDGPGFFGTSTKEKPRAPPRNAVPVWSPTNEVSRPSVSEGRLGCLVGLRTVIKSRKEGHDFFMALAGQHRRLLVTYLGENSTVRESFF